MQSRRMGTLKESPATEGTLKESPATEGTLKESPATEGTLKESPATEGTLKESPATEVHPAAWPPLPKGGNLHPSTACQDGMQPRPVHSPTGCSQLGRTTFYCIYHKLSTLSPISLHYPSNKQPEPARGEFRFLL